MREVGEAFVFSEKKKREQIYCEDIVFFESMGHYISVHTKDVQTYRTRCTMSRLFQTVGTEAFKRTHRAFAVNLEFVQGIEKNRVYLKPPWEAVPLSRTYKESFTDELAAFKGLIEIVTKK